MRFRIVLAVSPFLAACGGSGSALAPHGEPAGEIGRIFWWMAAGAVVVWAGVMVLAIHAVRTTGTEEGAKRVIVLGAAAPTVVLGALLVAGLAPLPGILRPAPEGSLVVRVEGKQWWWRIHYQPSSAPPFEVANELVLPVGELVEFLLESDNVIHSFWVPALGGKMDLIPGRTNRMVLRPLETGVFRGMCAEFCGRSHANMTFVARVVAKAEFEQWMAAQARPAASVSLP